MKPFVIVHDVGTDEASYIFEKSDFATIEALVKELNDPDGAAELDVMRDAEETDIIEVYLVGNIPAYVETEGMELDEKDGYMVFLDKGGRFTFLTYAETLLGLSESEMERLMAADGIDAHLVLQERQDLN